jgi:hypothetical protein
MVRRFWKNDEIQEAWKTYTNDIEDGDLCSLFFSTLALVQQSEAYIEKLIQKSTKDESKQKKVNDASSTSSIKKK